MDPLNNPYTPNAGARPTVVVGRDDQLDSFDVLLARLQKGRAAQSMIITGLRGVGKTVLLGAFRDKALAASWVPVEMEASKHDDRQFREQLFHMLRIALLELSTKTRWSEKFKKAASVLASFSMTFDPSGNVAVSLDAQPFRGIGDTNILDLDLMSVLLAVAEAAQEAQRGVALLIDEVQFLTPGQLEALIMALHKTVQRSLPLTFVGAGLPHVAELAGDAKSYAERLFKFVSIGRLSEEDSRRALIEPAEEEGASLTPEAIDIAIKETEGYPYFLQEFGDSIWNVAEHSPMDKTAAQLAAKQYQAKLDSSFFRVRLDRVTELQSAYLRAMAEYGSHPQSAGDVARTLSRTPQSLAPIRAELINMGLLYSPSYGYAAFTVPHFDQFMLRSIPTLIIPSKKTKK